MNWDIRREREALEQIQAMYQGAPSTFLNHLTEIKKF